MPPGVELGQPGVGDSQPKQRFRRGIGTHPHQIQRFTGPDDALEIRVATRQQTQSGYRVVGIRPALEIHPRDADQMVAHAHQVTERQGPGQIKPGP